MVRLFYFGSLQSGLSYRQILSNYLPLFEVMVWVCHR